MPEDRGALRQVEWFELFPSLNLLRAARCAFQPRMIALGAIGLLLTTFGWRAISVLFSGTEEPLLASWTDAYSRFAWSDDSESDLTSGISFLSQDTSTLDHPSRLHDIPAEPFASTWWNLAAPFRHVFSSRVSMTGLAFTLLLALWACLVWSFFGGAMTRVAVMQLGREERVSTKNALAFAYSKCFAYFSAPLFPLVGVALAAAPLALAGLLMKLDVGAVVVTLAWPLALLAGLLMTVLLLGLLFGWPLMAPTISAEGLDNFDALSRSYSYVFQRPLKYLLYLGFVVGLGILSMLLVSRFAKAVVYLPTWGASWGAGDPRVNELTAQDSEFPTQVLSDESDRPSNLAKFANSVLRFWRGAVRLLTIGFALAYFWSASSALYLRLRLEVDGTEYDEIHETSRSPALDLPPLKTDPQGVPTVPHNANAAEQAANAGEGKGQSERQIGPDASGNGP